MSRKILIIGDAPAVPTGFSNVIKNIFKYFNQEEWELEQLGINYYGDPHDVAWKLYPAAVRGDIWGFGRIEEFVAKNPDLIFILNDVWVIGKYLELFKQHYNKKKMPPIVVYFPVDSYAFDSDWFNNFDVVSKTVVYTQFGKDVVLAAVPDLEVQIIPHGTDRESFYKLNIDKREIKKTIYPKIPDFIDSFIVLNANRNQPRKRVDITIEGFKLFSEGKPENVKLYLHMGMRDAGFDIVKLCKRYDVDNRLIVTNHTSGIQTVTTKKLNIIYNATDVGINTSLGEGWGLVNTEHASVGVPQVVPAHSSCKELFDDCGQLIPINQWITNLETMTISGLVKPEDVASSLQVVYTNPDVYNSLSKFSESKFSSPEYDWVNISKRFQEVFLSCL